MAQTAALSPRKVVPSLILGTTSWLRNVCLPTWRRGQSAAVDVSVISTMQQQTMNRVANSPGYALQVGEERKINAHAESCHSRDILFVPLVVETIGGWSDEAIKTISHIGHLQGQILGSSPVEVI